MSTLTLPQGRSALGWITLGGQRLPVEIDPEWMRAFLQLVGRTGGVDGVDLASLYNETSQAPAPSFDAFSIPDPLTPAPFSVDQIADAPLEVRIASLEAEVQRLRGLMNDLQQGYQV